MSPRVKGMLIILIILLAIIPVRLCMKWMERRIRPRESGRRFLYYLLLVFGLIFVSTFLVVFGIRLLFPGA
ncbi:MAG: hypothetical protein IPP73_09675 [Chitinophagaceae bacterium]|nr:hypothetical protein [Chitinophagaceae bacterium]